MQAALAPVDQAQRVGDGGVVVAAVGARAARLHAPAHDVERVRRALRHRPRYASEHHVRERALRCAEVLYEKVAISFHMNCTTV